MITGVESRSSSGLKTQSSSGRVLRWAPALIFLLALFFNWPYLTAGYYADDFVLVNALASNQPPVSPWMGAWISTEVPAFDNLWWQDSGFGLSFWRPLPSLVIAGLTFLFGKNPIPPHALSLLMHATVAVLVFSLALRLTGMRSLAFLTGLLFVTCEDHTVTVAWISTLTDIMCTLGTLLSLIFHFKYLRQKRTQFLVWSLVFLAAALTCKETAAVTPVALILLTLISPMGSHRGQLSLIRLRAGLRLMIERPLTWAPQLIILIVYAAFYRTMGFGVGGSLQYIDPLSTPAAFGASLAVQLPVMWLGTLTVWPLFASGFDASLVPYIVVPGIAAFVLWVTGLWPYRRRATLVWAMVIYMLALLPQMCTVAGERGLYLPMAVGSILLAWPMMSLKSVARRFKSEPIIGTRSTRVMGWIVAIGVLICGVLVTAVRPWVISESFRLQEANVRTAAAGLELKPVDHLIVTNTSDLMQTFYFQDILKQHVNDCPRVWILSSAAGKFDLERISESSFRIRTDRPGWINNTMARYIRTSPLVRVGHTYELEVFTATIEEVTEDGTDVLAVRFNFEQAMRGGKTTFMTWRDGRYENIDLESIPIGGTVELSPYRSIWETAFSPAPGRGEH